MAFDIKSAKIISENENPDSQSKSKGFDIKSATEIKPNELNKPGLPLARRILEKVGQNLTNPKTKPIAGLATTNIGSIISSAMGVPEENIGAAALSIGGAYAGSKIGKPNLGFGIGTTAGNLLIQSAKKLRGNGDDINVADAILVGAAATAGGKVLDTALKGIGLSAKLIPETTRAKFFDKALQAVNVGKKALTRNWNKVVNELTDKYPSKTIDLTGVMSKVKSQFLGIDETLIPQLKTAVSRNSKLSQVVKYPNMASSLTLKEAQELKNAITSTTNTIIKKAVKGKTTPNERVVFDILDDIDSAIVSSFPQMMSVKQAYKVGKNAFDMARPLVEPGTAVEKSIFSQPKGLFGAGGTPFFGSTQGKLAAKKIMGMTSAGEKMFKAAKLAHDINRAADFVGRVAQIGVGGAILSKITGRKGNNRQTSFGG